MKGIILAGGQGTRLRPVTGIINKHLLPVGRYPMVHYAVEKMKEAGITEIVLVTGKQSAGLYTDYFGGGEAHGIQLVYKIQEEAGGIAQALSLSEPLTAPGEKLLVLLGDNLFGDSLAPHVRKFEQEDGGARVFLKEVDDPRRYGVPVLDGDRITHIEEKPEHPKSSYCVTGIYMYDHQVFDIIRGLRPSDRGELEITDVNNVYAAQGSLRYEKLAEWWIDAGTVPSLHEAYRRVMEEDRS